MSAQASYTATGRAYRDDGFTLSRDSARFVALALLIVSAFLMGGGSRADITSLIILRPLGFGLLAFAVMTMSKEHWRSLGLPGVVLAGMSLLMLAQLLPLPQQIWAQIPGRELIAARDELAGLGDIWRPLSLAPSRTLNAFFAMAIPLAGLCLASRITHKRRETLLAMLLIAGGVSMLFGLGQIAGPPRSSLYLYRITNEGLPVGLFSNRNHHAIFLASLIPLLAAFIFGRAEWRESSLVKMGGLVAILFGLAMVFATGSRAGSVLAIGNCAVLAVLLLTMQDTSRKGRSGRPVGRAVGPAVSLAVGVAVGVAVVMVIGWLTLRGLSLARFANADLSSDLRAEALPVLWQLVQTYSLAGSGFGSFFLVYQGVEPDHLMRPEYLNQAHNDPLQLIIEGGLAGAIIMLVGAIWLGRTSLRCWREWRGGGASGVSSLQAIFVWLALVTILLGSVLDYPLRTPSLVLTATLLAAFVGQLAESQFPETSSNTSPSNPNQMRN